MDNIDITIIGAYLSVLATLIAGGIGFLKLFRKFDPLPERMARTEEDIKLLQQQYQSCPYKDVDLAKFEQSLEELTKRTENDFRVIHQQSRILEMLTQGMTAMMDHMLTGNHQEQMEMIKSEMIKELVNSRKEMYTYE